jgi:hypothetical protein
VVEFARTDAARFQAVADRALRKPVVVLDTREPLLLSGGDDPPVANKRCSTVVIERGYAEDVDGSAPAGLSWPTSIPAADR